MNDSRIALGSGTGWPLPARGTRPLDIGKLGGVVVFAQESFAFDPGLVIGGRRARCAADG
ncbi:MAG: hypothetical protein QOE98_128 [Gaiellaceae bacterium]|nr:hypothetical protein [Gaiellaceae bacterium]